MTTFHVCNPSILMPARSSENVGKGSTWRLTWAALVLCAATAIAAPAQTFTSLLNFDLAGSYPQGAAFVQGVDGNLYGTTSGVSPLNAPIVPGTVFKMTPNGALTTLYTFCSQANCADGSNPLGGLILADDGDFYGTTYRGGATNGGTVFKITSDGALTTLYSFCAQANCTDGSAPSAALVQGNDGNFYGVTSLGGIASCGNAGGCGTIFRITSGGTLTTLHGFDNGYPSARLIQATDGNFYGVTWGPWYLGFSSTIFRMTLNGAFTTIDNFGSTGLVQSSNGDLYGTGDVVGSSYNWTFEKITTSGAVTVLWGWGQGGFGPSVPLIQATDGNFYGTLAPWKTKSQDPYGRLFRLHSTGHPMRWLHSFDNDDGSNPAASLVQATDGNFYGTTLSGGANGYGTAFRLSMGLDPFVSFIRAFGKVGETAQILGQGFTGATGVSFNGTPATFTVQSDTYLTAKIPAGAGTGFVTITTPSGTLKSNLRFRVTPQIFSISKTQGPVGTSVVITGESFTRSIAVTFGTIWATSFSIDSDTQITATVPAGAVSGKVGVLTSGGRAYSNMRFIVTP